VFNQIETRSIVSKFEVWIWKQGVRCSGMGFWGEHFLLLIEGGEVLSIIDRTNGSAESRFNKRAGVWPYHRSQTSAKRPDPIFARLLNGLLRRGSRGVWPVRWGQALTSEFELRC